MFDIIEWCDTLDAAVEADDDRDPDVEKVKLAFVEIDSLDMREFNCELDRDRANASYDAFLVCDGARVGITGAAAGAGEGVAGS